MIALSLKQIRRDKMPSTRVLPIKDRENKMAKNNKYPLVKLSRKVAGDKVIVDHVVPHGYVMVGYWKISAHKIRAGNALCFDDSEVVDGLVLDHDKTYMVTKSEPSSVPGRHSISLARLHEDGTVATASSVVVDSDHKFKRLVQHPRRDRRDKAAHVRAMKR
jgi:hypothetical protein